MSVEPLKVGKTFVKVENNIPPKQKLKVEDKPKDDRKYTYIPNSNGNIDVDVFMDKLLKKLSSSGITQNNNIYDDVYGVKPVEVDIKKEIYIDKLDENQVTVDKVVEGKVNNKLDKLRALRKK
jgi:hypothetical protein